jgi:hypothetical protein
MSRILELPEPVYDALESVAAANGTTPVGWIAAHLPLRAAMATDGARTLADVFAGRTGRIASGGKEKLSECGSKRFADDLELKRREERL